MTGWQWLMLAAGFLVLEVITPTFFFWFLTLAAVLMALLVSVVEPSWQMQLMGFAVLALVNGALWRKMMKPKTPDESFLNEADLLNHRGRAFVSKRFVLQTPIENGRGRLQIGDTFWQLESEQSALPAGTLIEVVADLGGRLRVKEVSDA